ncbi:MAG TPA: peroxidase, partial [Actinobacteria bacterium]|nr:peroxidase [Actinomycetota bacterium]
MAAWIHTVPEEEADGKLAELYDLTRDPSSGRVDNIMSIHSLHPEGLNAHNELYEAVMTGTATLRKVEREMIALVTS